MVGNKRSLLLAIPGCAAIALALNGSVSIASSSVVTGVHAATRQGPAPPHRSGSQDLYLGNILGGVLLYSTGKDEQQIGLITTGLPRVTSVWVDPSGILYAFSDNAQAPYETIEEFQPGATSPFFSLSLERYGGFVAADAEHNVYAQGENPQEQQVIDVYPPGSQLFANEYVVPPIGRISAPESMAFDATGTLLVGVAALADNRQGEIGAVFRLDAASGQLLNLNLQNAVGGIIATDGAGNLFVGGNRSISVYPPGATSPSRTFHTKDGIVTLTAGSDGTLYVDTNPGGISVYPPGKSHPKSNFLPQAQVSGLALGPG